MRHITQSPVQAWLPGSLSNLAMGGTDCENDERSTEDTARDRSFCIIQEGTSQKQVGSHFSKGEPRWSLPVLCLGH